MPVLNAIQSILSIMLMISIGYILTEIKWFDDNSSKLLSRLVTSVSLPAYMMVNLLSNYDKEKLSNSARGLIVPFISMTACYILGVLISKLINVKQNRRGIFQSMFFVSNTIFIGLPVNLALFGENSVPYVLLYYIANTTFFWTVGVYSISRDGMSGHEKIFTLKAIKRIFSPPLMSFLISIVLILFQFQPPKFIMDAFKYVGNLTTPLSMFFIGITIHSVGIKDIKFDRDIAALLFGRFIISPFAVYLLNFIFPLPSLMKNVFIIQAAMPVMTQTAIISKAYNADHRYAAVMISVSTIASLLFIPVFMVFMK